MEPSERGDSRRGDTDALSCSPAMPNQPQSPPDSENAERPANSDNEDTLTATTSDVDDEMTVEEILKILFPEDYCETEPRPVTDADEALPQAAISVSSEIEDLSGCPMPVVQAGNDSTSEDEGRREPSGQGMGALPHETKLDDTTLAETEAEFVQENTLRAKIQTVKGNAGSRILCGGNCVEEHRKIFERMQRYFESTGEGIKRWKGED